MIACSELTTPTATLPKLKPDSVSVGGVASGGRGGVASPIPVNFTVPDSPVVESAIVSELVIAPSTEGTKDTEIKHDCEP
jgi:hypothetical protein